MVMFDNCIALVTLFLTVAISSVFGALYTDPAQLPQNKNYDFIIVGGKCLTLQHPTYNDYLSI